MTLTKATAEAPKSLKIWGHNYAVKKKKSPKLFNGTKPIEVLGLFLSDDQEIHLSSTGIKTKSREAEVLLHEILHAICYNSNVFNGIENKHEHEEHVVDTLANALILVFKDNPSLIDYIKEMLNDK